jgi:hypothetical protein
MGQPLRQDPLYSPAPGVIPGEIDVAAPPVAREERAPTPLRPRPQGLDNPEHVRPWRNRVAALAFLVVAAVSIAIAVLAL